MKCIKYLVPVLLMAVLFGSCYKEYEDPTGPSLEGTHVWKYTDVKLAAGGYGRIGGQDTTFIQVKDTVIFTYNYAMRDSLNSIIYRVDEENVNDIYAKPLIEDAVTPVDFTYFATYRFSNDTMYLEKFPVTTIKGHTRVEHNQKPLFRSAYVRPGKNRE